jgi:Tfp pilus assembly protein FimV
VLVSLALALAVAALGLRDGSAAAVEPTPARLATPRFVIAQQGDTLWSIAARLAPGSDTTELVDRLVLLNGDTVYVGQAVLLP